MKISSYTNGNPPQNADEFIVARSGSNRKLSWSNLTDALQAFFVALTGNQTVAGVKTFSSFPVTPSSAPTTDYQVANKQYVDTVAIPLDGWIPYSAVTPTRASADDPTYVLTFAGVDLTSTISVGMRLKWTQNGTVRYGIVTAISFSTNTTLTLYGGTDYDVDDTASFAISAFHYSPVKAPLGFPANPSKWTVTKTDTTNRSQTTSGTTVYNLGSISIVIPIGAWNLDFSAKLQIGNDAAAAGNKYMSASLSTSSSTINAAISTGVAGGSINFARLSAVIKTALTLSSKTTYYFTARDDAGFGNIIYALNAEQTLTIKAISAYL